ncbi:MAG: hypothetical protein IPK22_11325 [Verrucomicrobiaceae bacterium]|nr:hypothetical protein [Verrucomicrobiaceae bacterium]
MELEQLTAIISEKHHGTIALIGFILFAAGRGWTAITNQGGLLDTLTQRGGLRGIWRSIVHGETPPKR